MSDVIAKLALPWVVVVTAYSVCPASLESQSPDTVQIGMLVDRISEEFAPALEQLSAEVSAVVGSAAVVRFSPENTVESQFNAARAEELYGRLVAGDVDVILAFGPVAAEAVAGRPEYPKPTILFGALNQDVVDVGPSRETSGIPNFTYVTTSNSYARDFTTFKSLYDFQSIGVVVAAEQLAVPSIRDALERQSNATGVDYELIPYSTPSNLEPFLDRIDAFYLADSWGIPEFELEEVADLLIDRRIPSFSGGRREDVELGFMATHQGEENLDRFFRRVALHIEAVVNEENLSDRPVFVEFNETLILNFNTAELVGVPLKVSLIATTEFVGDMINSISERTYSLEDVVQEALLENLLLDSQRRDVELGLTDVRAAWSNYLPSVTANASGTALDPDLAELSGGTNPQYSALGSLVLNQTVFAPGANANITIQGHVLDAERENLRAAELDLVVDAANAFFTALILKANLQIQQQNLDVTNRNLAIAQQNFEIGQSGRGDVLRLQSASARDMQAFVEAISQLEQAFYALNQLLNNPIDREIDVVDGSIDLFDADGFERLRQLLDDQSSRAEFEEFLIAEATRNAPELAALESNIAAVERSVDLYGLQRFLPNIGAVAQYNRTFRQGGLGVPPPEVPTLSDNYSLGLQVSIPLFDSNLRNVQRQTAEIQRDQLRLNQEYLRSAIDKSVRDVVLELVNQVANIALSAVSEEAAAEGLELTEAAYRSGAVNIVELLDAQTSLLQAQLASASATYNFLSISMALGRLIDHFFILSSDDENAEFNRRFEEFRARRAGGGQ